jgi:hypothetical protein
MMLCAFRNWLINHSNCEVSKVFLGADHLTFEGGGVILKKNFLQGYSEQKKYLH